MVVGTFYHAAMCASTRQCSHILDIESHKRCHPEVPRRSGATKGDTACMVRGFLLGKKHLTMTRCVSSLKICEHHLISFSLNLPFWNKGKTNICSIFTRHDLLTQTEKVGAGSNDFILFYRHPFACVFSVILHREQSYVLVWSWQDSARESTPLRVAAAFL